jgi:hypothetical protein
MNNFLRGFPASSGVIITLLSSIVVFMLFHGSISEANTVASMATFLFGIFVSFTISNKYSRLTNISSLLKIDEANLLAIYKYSHEFGTEVTNKVRELIDNNLVTQLDYYLVDYRKSNSSYYKLFDYILTLEPTTPGQEVAYAQINSLLTLTSSNRKQVETLVLQRTSTLEWVSLGSLLCLIYMCILGINTGSPFSVIASSVMVTVAVLLLFVLRDLDTLSWQQDKWIWQPMHNLFLDLDLLPYYPSPTLSSHEAKPPIGDKVRVAHYKADYPNVSEKDIELRVIDR